jgi:tRNA nucleotidyltransferase (CCA-adding enzyme)
VTGEHRSRRASRAGRPDRVLRGHETLPHTADVGIRAVGPDLPALFEEAALAVGAIAADPGPGVAEAPIAVETVELDGADLPALAFAWLNELIGLVDINGPLVRAEVRVVEPVAGGGWRLRGLAAFGGTAAARLDIKSATYHGLTVEPVPGGWRLTAYLDI